MKKKIIVDCGECQILEMERMLVWETYIHIRLPGVTGAEDDKVTSDPLN